MREIEVDIIPGLDAEEIKELLNEENGMSLFTVAHALLEHQDDRAEILSVKVQRVTIDPAFPNQVQIEFSTSWSIYASCRDMRSAGEENERETATYTEEGGLIFIVPEPRRPANDC